MNNNNNTSFKRNPGLELLTGMSTVILALYSGLLFYLIYLISPALNTDFPSLFNPAHWIRYLREGGLEAIFMLLLMACAWVNVLFFILTFKKYRDLKRKRTHSRLYIFLLSFSLVSFAVLMNIPLLRLASIGYLLMSLLSAICIYVIYKSPAL